MNEMNIATMFGIIFSYMIINSFGQNPDWIKFFIISIFVLLGSILIIELIELNKLTKRKQGAKQE